MKVTMRPIDSIRPYKNNPRLNDAAVAKVKASLEAFGWQQPIVVDRKGEIIVGHTRWRAAKERGEKEVPTVEATKLTPAQVKAYRLADNKVGEIATWDEGKLAAELKELKLIDWDMTAFGWTPEDLRGLEAQATQGLQAPDEVPKAPNPKDVKTRRGDVWELGEHRLMCGSSTEPADVEKLMAGEAAAICATDPPYLVDYTGVKPVEDGKGGYKPGGKDWSDTYREIEIKDADGFFRALFSNMREVLAPQAAIYCWHAHKRVGLIQRIWEELDILDHQQIVWVKPTPVFGRCFWHFRHEPCMMGWKRGEGPRHDGVHDIDSVWRVGLDDEAARKGKQKVSAAETDVWEVDWEGKARVVGNEHPTQKPVELFARPIRRHTKPGAVCFEPFSGSGSQIIACEQTGRRCRAMELEPVFVEVAVRRWEAFTGKKGVRIPSPNGKTIVPPAAMATPRKPASARRKATAKV
jgi:DNA modification methylase